MLQHDKSQIEFLVDVCSREGRRMLPAGGCGMLDGGENGGCGDDGGWDDGDDIESGRRKLAFATLFFLSKRSTAK